MEESEKIAIPLEAVSPPKSITPARHGAVTHFGSEAKGAGEPGGSKTDNAEDYQSTLEYLYGLLNYEKNSRADYNSSNFRLDRMRCLLELLDNPQAALQIVHVAGTKGKGTVATLVASCLSACGWKTALYTSPHLVKLEERFQINGKIATQQQIVSLAAEVRAVAHQFEGFAKSLPTFFEFTTAMAFLHFYRQKVELAVLEVGLGGRLDSTNVCTPLVSVITSISLDHQRQLGNSIPQIAAEKAGIIKPRTPVVCSALEAEARRIIEQTCSQLASPLVLSDRDYSYEWERAGYSANSTLNAPSASVRYLPSATCASQFGEFCVRTPLLGAHQAQNIGAVLATIDVLALAGFRPDRNQVLRAIESTTVPARLQIVSRSPIKIIDTAHNPASMRAGLEALSQHFPGKEITAVFSASSDKDYRLMLEMLVRSCRQVFLTAFQKNPRSVSTDSLADDANKLVSEVQSGCVISRVSTPSDAWATACEATPEDALVYATGSFFLAGELIEHLGLQCADSE